MKLSQLMLAIFLIPATHAEARPMTRAELLLSSEETRELATPGTNSLRMSTQGLDSTEKPDSLLTDLFLIGEKIWKIVEDGKPVSNFESQKADVVPRNAGNWENLSGWQPQTFRRFERVLKNGFGNPILTFRYRVVYQWGGQHEGRGRYLMGISVIPEVIEVGWGWNFQVSVSIPTIYNSGTSGDPLAAAQIVITTKLQSPLTSLQTSETYEVRGDGTFRNLQTPPIAQ